MIFNLHFEGSRPEWCIPTVSSLRYTILVGNPRFKVRNFGMSTRKIAGHALSILVYMCLCMCVCCRHLGASAGQRGRMFASGLKHKHAMQALWVALEKEQQQWQPVLPRPAMNSQVTSYLLQKTSS